MEIMTGTLNSEISYQMKDIMYILYQQNAVSRLLVHKHGKFTMERMKSCPFSIKPHSKYEADLPVYVVIFTLV